MLLSTVLAADDTARDRERERIAKVLHDETGGQLMAVATQLELLRMDGVEGLEPALAALEKAFDSVRTLSRSVHPKIVERVGLAAALDALVKSNQQRFAGKIRCDITSGVSGPAEIYRIAEELLDNSIRHSKARTIELVLTPAGELIVRDDGVGFDAQQITTGVGLLRVRFWGGKGHLRVRLRTTAESGTMFRVNQSHAI